jgi:non-ribosomal peptide synthetase component F
VSLPADLSQRLAALSPAKRALLLSKLATGPVRQPDQKPVLSFAQERMLFLQRLFPDSHIYNTPMMIGLKGPLDVALLERSLNQIVARHEALRTLFPWREGGHGVEVLPRLELALTPQEIAPDALLNTLSTILRQPFALGSEPPIRARLLRLSPGHHVLALVLHHVAYDGWSRRLLLEELSRGYAGAELSPLPISYFDFARWQRARSFSEGLAYWRQVLDQAPDLTTLPADRWRGEKTSHAGGTHRFSLSPEIRQGLQGLAREADATLFMVMLAAFFTLVHRYSGQVDLVLGIPVAGRDRPEAQSLIGVFINSLAVRVRLEPSLSFPELLARVKQACLGAYGHQEVPFEHLVQQLGPGRDLTRHPFFQLFFNFRNLPQACLEPTDLELETLEIDRGVCAFDLTLEVVVDGPGLEVALTYSRDLFEPTTVASLAEHYRNILEAILESPGIGLDHIAMLSEPEIRFQLVDWNAGVHPPEPRTFPQLVGAQARLTPQAPAVVFGSRRLSYAELETKAGQLARYLMAQGVGQHEIVGLCLRRSLEMVIGLLAITKAGAAYLPLDPRGPASRNLTMLADAEARVVLTLSDQPLPDFPGLVLPLDSLPETVWTGEGDEVEVSASSLVYVLFTSGSTGRPKGVMIEHRQLTSYAGAVGQRCQLGPGLSYAMVQPLTVDSSQTVLAASLTTGGCLHILSEEMSLDAPALGELFCREGIQVLKIAPSHLAALMRSSSAPAQRGPDPGGRGLHLELARQLPGAGSLPCFQPLRPHRDHGGLAGLRPARKPSAPNRPHWPAPVWQQCLHPGRSSAALAAWRGRRALHRGRPGGARLPGQPRADGAAIPAQPLRRGPNLSHGGQGPLHVGWPGRVPGPRRPSGEDPGLARGAFRDRKNPLRDRRGEQGAGVGRPGQHWRQGLAGLSGGAGRTGPGKREGAPGRPAARPHDPAPADGP